MTESSGVPPVIAARAESGEGAGADPRGLGKDRAIRKRGRAFLWALWAGLILLVVAGLALVGAYIYLSRQQPAPLSAGNPVDAVRPTAVAPDLAALSLAGESDERVIKAALDAGELETAYAGLAYSVLLPDTIRSGQWLLLAGRYGAAAGDKSSRPADAARAELAYQAALDQASLSPLLSDVTRANTSLQVARGTATLERGAVARLALKQSENIARFSLTLLPAQRRDVLQQVVAGYRSIGDPGPAVALEGQIGAASIGPDVRVPPAGDLLATLRGTVVLPAEVTAAMVARQQAAAALAARWLAAAPSTRQELAAALAGTLQAEASARSTFYGGAGSLSQADRLALLHDRIVWLTLKYRVARVGYGVSLVPDWEGKTTAIADELAAAYTDLINGYGLQLDTLPAADSASGRLQLLTQALLWTRLGLFPDHAEPLLRGQLIDAAHQLWTRRGGAGLVVVVQDVGGRHFYLLSGADNQATPPPATR